MYEMTFENNKGREFLVLFLEPGESGAYPAAMEPDKQVIEFYDVLYPHTQYGQFVSRYFADEIMPGYAGINLSGGVPVWSIDKDAMNLIRAWASEWWTKP